MNDFQTVHIIALLGSLILVCSGFMVIRSGGRKELKQALIWVIIAALLMLGYAAFA